MKISLIFHNMVMNFDTENADLTAKGDDSVT